MVKFGIIGIGNMGTQHANNLYNGKVDGACLTAVCDIDPSRLAYVKENLPGVALFDKAEDLIENADIDVVLIAVPHYLHPV